MIYLHYFSTSLNYQKDSFIHRGKRAAPQLQSEVPVDKTDYHKSYFDHKKQTFNFNKKVALETRIRLLDTLLIQSENKIWDINFRKLKLTIINR